MFEAFGMLFAFIKKLINTFSEGIGIISDWVDYMSDKSKSELTLLRKEDDVNLQIKVKNLDEKLEKGLKDAGIKPAK